MSLCTLSWTDAGKIDMTINNWWWLQMEALTMVGMLLHLLEGGISVRRSGFRLMLTVGGLFSCMFLDTPPEDSSPGELQWLVKLPFPKHRMTHISFMTIIICITSFSSVCKGQKMNVKLVTNILDVAEGTEINDSRTHTGDHSAWQLWTQQPCRYTLNVIYHIICSIICSILCL